MDYGGRGFRELGLRYQSSDFKVRYLVLVTGGQEASHDLRWRDGKQCLRGFEVTEGFVGDVEDLDVDLVQREGGRGCYCNNPDVDILV